MKNAKRKLHINISQKYRKIIYIYVKFVTAVTSLQTIENKKRNKIQFPITK